MFITRMNLFDSDVAHGRKVAIFRFIITSVDPLIAVPVEHLLWRSDNKLVFTNFKHRGYAEEISVEVRSRVCSEH